MRDVFDKGEKEILESFKRGGWKSVPHLNERKKQLKEYTRATLHKDNRLNIRISKRDLNELQRGAVHEGLPYQPYVSSLLHKFVNGYFIERP